MSGPKTMARRILITGANGQMGFELQMRLQAEALVKPRDTFDLSKHRLVQKTLDTLRPDVVINCAALASDSQAAEKPLTAAAVNGTDVANLAVACFSNDIPLIHFSCPTVFGDPAATRKPFTEDCPVAPTTPLGTSKLFGEYGILQAAELARQHDRDPRYWILRVGALFERPWRTYPNLLQSILAIAEQSHRRQQALPADQVMSPTSTEDVATAVLCLLKELPHWDIGVYHIANEGFCTMAELAQRLLMHNNRGRGFSELLFSSVRALNTLESTNAPYMQAYQALDCTKFTNASPRRLPPWEEAVEKYMRDRRQS